MALWANMEEKQSQHLYRTEDSGHCMRSNGEKVLTACTNRVSTHTLIIMRILCCQVMERRVTVADVSCILSFLFIIYFSFFGTGNIASVNSFDPSTIRCFVARSNPPLMAALLLLKILLPYLV